MHRRLDCYHLVKNARKGLGLNVAKSQKILLLLAVALASGSVAVTGSLS